MFKSLRSCAFIAVVAVSACGGKTTLDLETPTPADAERLAISQCAKQQRCDPEFFSHRYHDQAECVRVLTKVETQRLVVDPNVTLPAGYFAGCVSALDAMNGPSCGGSPAACRGLPGKIAAGGACLTTFDCDATSSCTFGLSAGALSSCGTCEPRAKPCGGCAADETCIAGGCQPKRRAGEACDFGVQCLDGLSCRGGTCNPVLAVGDACDPTFGCDGELVCGAISHTCCAYVYADTGSPCGHIGDDYVDCRFSACRPNAPGATTKTCQALLPDGAPCDPETALCDANERCIEGKCTQAVCW